MKIYTKKEVDKLLADQRDEDARIAELHIAMTPKEIAAAIRRGKA